MKLKFPNVFGQGPFKKETQPILAMRLFAIAIFLLPKLITQKLPLCGLKQ